LKAASTGTTVRSAVTGSGASSIARSAAAPTVRFGERAAAIYTLIGTARLNGIDPQAWLADVLSRIHDHPASQLYLLLPWY
jgi:hypothetical protein